MGREYSKVKASGIDKGDGDDGEDGDENDNDDDVDAEDRGSEGATDSEGAWVNRLVVLRIKGATMATAPK